MARKPAKKPAARKKAPRKVVVAKGVKVPRGTEEKLSRKKGSSNVGKYKKVAPNDFCGASGGSSKYSYPVNTVKRARAALAYAHNAPNPSGIKRCVHKKYPEMAKRSAARAKKR